MVFLTLGVSGMQKPSRGHLKSVITRERFTVYFWDWFLSRQPTKHAYLTLHTLIFWRNKYWKQSHFAWVNPVLFMSIRLLGMQAQSRDGQDLSWASVGPSGWPWGVCYELLQQRWIPRVSLRLTVLEYTTASMTCKQVTLHVQDKLASDPEMAGASCQLLHANKSMICLEAY